MNTIARAVGATSYPGRGILAGKAPDGRLVLSYFIMGRSENSRNRVFVPDGDGLRTRAFDPEKCTDPSLILYAPVRAFQDRIIITNGDQTDTICDALASGGTFASALRTRSFEPDAPNYTPRISAMATLANGDASLKMAVLKASDARGSACDRFFFEYERIEPGAAHFLHTYLGDGNPLPPFAGEPARVRVPDIGIDALADEIWNALDRENRVALWVRAVDPSTGAAETRITNAHA